MTPRFQTIINAKGGDCMSACIASLLDLPYDAQEQPVPNFRAQAMAQGEYADMRDFLNGFLLALGYQYFELDPWEGRGLWMIDTYCVLTMPSQVFPDGKHAVVGLLQNQWKEVLGVRVRESTSLTVAHDPNPCNAPYEGISPLRVGFLVKTCR